MIKSLTPNAQFTLAPVFYSLRPIDLYWIGRVLWRSKTLVLSCAGTFSALALAYCLTTSPLYTSAVRILVGPRQPIVLTEQQSPGNEQIEAAYVDSQVEILKSGTVLDRVVKAKNLTADPEFVRSYSTFSLAGITNMFSSLAGISKDTSDTDQSAALNKLRANLTIKRVGLTYVLEAAVTTSSPAKSSEIANSVADAFLRDNLEARSLSAEESSQWLQGRVNELRTLAVAADTRVQKFKSDNNIITAGKGLVTDQEVSEISSQLTIARGQLSESQAKYDRAASTLSNGNSNGVNPENLSIADSLANGIVMKLRSNYIANDLQIMELVKLNGENHSSVQKLKAENAMLTQSITDEVQRIADSYRNDLEITKARVLSLEASMRKAVDTSNLAGTAQVQLNDLEREAESYRAIYQMSLSKLQESTQQQSFPVNEFRVITAATPILQKSWPKSFLTLALAGMAGIALGALLALARATTDKKLYAPLDVIQKIGGHCITAFPQLNGKKFDTTTLKEMHQQAVEEPLREIRLTLGGSIKSGQGVIFGIASTNHGEGRSTITLALASSYVAAGYKTLLVDADFSNPYLSRSLALGGERGLIAALTTNEPAANSILIDKTSGLHLVPAGKPSSLRQRLLALAGPNVSKIMAEWRNDYDVTIIDFPPLRESNDTLAFTDFVDNYIYMIEAGATSSTEILAALEKVDQISSRIKGFVLTKVKINFLGKSLVNKPDSPKHKKSPPLETNLAT